MPRPTRTYFIALDRLLSDLISNREFSQFPSQIVERHDDNFWFPLQRNGCHLVSRYRNHLLKLRTIAALLRSPLHLTGWKQVTTGGSIPEEGLQGMNHGKEMKIENVCVHRVVIQAHRCPWWNGHLLFGAPSWSRFEDAGVFRKFFGVLSLPSGRNKNETR